MTPDTDSPDLALTGDELMAEHGVAGAVAAPPRPDDGLETITDPIERARAAGDLADYHGKRQVEYATVRAAAIQEALDTIPKATQTSVAAALGISKGMVGKIVSRHKEG